MKVIVPAKSTSKRVPDKNWRPFDGNKSLVYVTIEQLIHSGFSNDDIYVSSDCRRRLGEVSKRYNVQTLMRTSEECQNSYPLVDWIRRTVEKVDWTGSIAWAQVCDPLFTDYAGALAEWAKSSSDFDSLCVIQKTKQYLLDCNKAPVGWQFGEYHSPSQLLPQMYLMPFTFSVLTETSIDSTGYHIGCNPIWYETERTIDIDTETDFEIAQLYYASKHL